MAENNHDGHPSGRSGSGWIWAALMPPPPVMVPQVGRGREREAARPLAGAGQLPETLSARPEGGRPDVLIVLSPHQPYVPGALFINNAPWVTGGLGRFGAPEVNFRLETSDLIENLAHDIQSAGLPVALGSAADLTPDHGTTVPLHFLAPTLGPLPPVILASPIGLSPDEAYKLGRVLASIRPEGRKLALLASGDLSHRLLSDAPAGFDPQGPLFDQALVKALAEGDPEALKDQWPLARLRAAGECGFRSALTLMGLTGAPLEVLSYEGPFGVGYANALWINDQAI